MKRFLIFAVAMMLAFGFAGQASAAFSNTGIHMVVYEEIDNTSPNTTDSGTVEMHFEFDSDILNNWVIPWNNANGFTVDDIPDAPISTGIGLDDFDTTSWDDLYVGLYGRSSLFTVLGIDPADYQINTGSAGEFSTLVNVTTGYTGTFDDLLEVSKSDSQSYVNAGLGTNVAGTYSGLVTSNSANFNAELRLAADGTGEIDVYYLNDRTDTSTRPPEEMGSVAFYLDQNNELIADFNPVPIPGAVILLGSGLLGLLGIRRRRA